MACSHSCIMLKNPFNIIQPLKDLCKVKILKLHKVKNDKLCKVKIVKLFRLYGTYLKKLLI